MKIRKIKKTLAYRQSHFYADRLRGIGVMFRIIRF